MFLVLFCFVFFFFPSVVITLTSDKSGIVLKYSVEPPQTNHSIFVPAYSPYIDSCKQRKMFRYSLLFLLNSLYNGNGPTKACPKLLIKNSLSTTFFQQVMKKVKNVRSNQLIHDTSQVTTLLSKTRDLSR